MGIVLFCIVIFGLHKASTQTKNLPQYSAPTPDQPVLTGPQLRKVGMTLSLFGPPDPKHPFQLRPMDKNVRQNYLCTLLESVLDIRRFLYSV